MPSLLCQLRENVTIQAKTYLKDAYGGYGENWRDTMVCWAAINPAPSQKRASSHPMYHVFFRDSIPVRLGMRLKTRRHGTLVVLSHPTAQTGKRAVMVIAQLMEGSPSHDA